MLISLVLRKLGYIVGVTSGRHSLKHGQNLNYDQLYDHNKLFAMQVGIHCGQARAQEKHSHLDVVFCLDVCFVLQIIVLYKLERQHTYETVVQIRF